MFRRKVDSFMISLICFLEFAAATADALSIVEFDGMTFMMLIAIQFFFICDDQDCERAERSRIRYLQQKKDVLFSESCAFCVDKKASCTL